VRRRVQELSENPYLGLRLVGELEGFWKDRVGKYRTIYKIDETKKRSSSMMSISENASIASRQIHLATIIFLYSGQLIEHGPTETTFTEPNDPRTKEYIEGAFG
jgi:ABC-type phosphate transport system ATPase subunit